jgi:hypothetical protein
MSDTTNNVPDVIRQEAKAKALAILNSEPGCISYVRPEDLETAALFIPVVSIIKPVIGDFHPAIPGIGILPKVQLQNNIREKSGTNIIRTEEGKRGEYVWTAHCYGEKRMPDGSMETTDGVYEFDAEKRAELDFIKQPEKYKSDIDKRKYVLELCKFGQSKAVTGAQWIVIKKLAKIAASFKTEEELLRGMKLFRIDRNINGIMQDPNMREAIIQHALGSTEQVFGPKQVEAQPAATPQRRIDPDSGEITEPAPMEEGQADLFHDDIPFEESQESKIKRLREQIIDLLKDPGISNKNKEEGLKWLSTPEADNLDKLIEKQTLIEGAIKNYRLRAEKAKKGKGAA